MEMAIEWAFGLMCSIGVAALFRTFLELHNIGLNKNISHCEVFLGLVSWMAWDPCFVRAFQDWEFKTLRIYWSKYRRGGGSGMLNETKWRSSPSSPCDVARNWILRWLCKHFMVAFVLQFHDCSTQKRQLLVNWPNSDKKAWMVSRSLMWRLPLWYCLPFYSNMLCVELIMIFYIVVPTSMESLMFFCIYSHGSIYWVAGKESSFSFQPLIMEGWPMATRLLLSYALSGRARSF